jgi:cytochrome b561
LRHYDFYGSGSISCIGSALYAQTLNGKDPNRAKAMHVHKSMGLLMGALLIPRIGLRLISKIPAHLPAPRLQLLISKGTHYGLLGSIGALAGSGIAMGYYSGYGVPFFAWEGIAGATGDSKDPKFAKLIFGYHQAIGQLFEYLVPLHVGGVVVGAFQGFNLLKRVNPFASQVFGPASSPMGVSQAIAQSAVKAAKK